jgi:hypothetical protein
VSVDGDPDFVYCIYALRDAVLAWAQSEIERFSVALGEDDG